MIHRMIQNTATSSLPPRCFNNSVSLEATPVASDHQNVTP